MRFPGFTITLRSLLSAVVITLSVASAQTNTAPAVVLPAVPTVPHNATTITLTGTVTDDGLPLPSNVTLRWCKFTGPGPVRFGSPNSLTTTASFDIAGTYVILLKANDGALIGQGQTTVIVNPNPTVPFIVNNIMNASPSNNLDPLYSTRFLTLGTGAPVSPNNPVSTAGLYYAAVDPTNAKMTFSQWKAANNFPPSTPPSALLSTTSAECCTAGVYGNQTDLGFGRRMVSARNGGDVAFYVVNYANEDDAINDVNPVLTVCMEYSAAPGDNPNNRYTKFYTYGPLGNRVGTVNFDLRGMKSMPEVCIACHGGALGPNGSVPPNGNLGSTFLPFDLESFSFSCQEGFSREELEPMFKEFNQTVLDTNPSIPNKELIEGWYGGVGLPNDIQCNSYVPTGWTQNPNIYLNVVAKSCRTCHYSRPNPALDFHQYTDFQSPAFNTQLGFFLWGPAPSGFRMPHALQTFKRFWNTTTPHQPALLFSGWQNGFTVPSTPNRLHVNFAATGAGTGATWNDAFTTLSAALTAAAQSNGTITEIWVAGGATAYRPDTTGLADPRTATFLLPTGVSVYGGFAGGETILSQRNVRLNETILSGDLGSNDGAAFAQNGENAYHVVTVTTASPALRLDGFTIRGGNANGAPVTRGGGLLVTGGMPTIENCTFTSNDAVDGGAFACVSTTTRVMSSRFFGNRAGRGAGAFIVGGSTTAFINSVFAGNAATITGGGAIAADAAAITLQNSSIGGNSAATDGGGIFAANTSTVTLANTIVYGNTDAGGQDEEAQLKVVAGGSPIAANFSVIQGLVSNFGANNTAANPLFRSLLGCGIPGQTPYPDLRVLPGSSAIDSGSNAALPQDAFDMDHDCVTTEGLPFDIDGRPRRNDDFQTADVTAGGTAPIVDRGAYEFDEPSLGVTAAGTVRATVGGPENVLFVDGSAGGTRRRVDIDPSAGFTIAVNPPTGQASAAFALFGLLGEPQPTDAISFGAIGTMCFTPAPIAIADARAFTLTENFGFNLPQLVGSTPAPFSINVPAVGFELSFTLQGVMFDQSSPSVLSVTNGVLVNVTSNPDRAPIATVSGPNGQSVMGTTPVVFDGSASCDPDGFAIVSYTWTRLDNGPALPDLTGLNTPIISFTAPNQMSTLLFQLVVSDGTQSSAPTQVSVSVGSLNTPPVFAFAMPPSTVTVITQQSATLTASASDTEGQPITYTWQQTGSSPAGFNASFTTALTNASVSFTAPNFTPSCALPAPPPAPCNTNSTVNLDHVDLFFSVTATDGLFMTTANVTVRLEKPAVTFQSDIYPIFASSVGCTGCHFGGGQFPPFDGTPAATYVILTTGTTYVNTAPNQCGNSLLLTMPIYGGAGMPSCLFAVNDANYLKVLTWIQQGAPFN